MHQDLFYAGIVGHDYTKINVIDRKETFFSLGSRRIETLHDVAIVMKYFHASLCPCEIADLGLVDNIWRINLPSDGRPEEYHPTSQHRLTKETAIDEILPLHDGQTHYMSHLMFGRDLDVAERQRANPQIQRRIGDVCLVSYTEDPTLPLSSKFNFNEIMNTPGICYVNKMDIIREWYHEAFDIIGLSRPCMPLIRRPPRFGKSAFLSTCSATFGDNVPHSNLPRPLSDPHEFDCEPPLLILELDFAQLVGTYEEMEDKVKQFMSQTAIRFWKRYFPHEEVPDDGETSWQLIKRVAVNTQSRIFLALDNYTHPFLECDSWTAVRIEECIWRVVLRPIFNSVGSFVCRGLITGLELRAHQHRPFSDCPPFARATRDITSSSTYAFAIGLSAEDVVNLARVVLGVDFDAQKVILEPCCVPDGAVICTQDAVDVIRSLQSGATQPLDSGTMTWIAGDDFDPDVPCLTPSGSHDSDLSDKMPKTPVKATFAAHVQVVKDDENEDAPDLYDDEFK